MFGFSMVQMVRAHSYKLDKSLRDQILHLYKPFRWTPCFLHNLFEGFIKKRKRISIIIKFEKGCFEEGCQEVDSVFSNHTGCTIRNEFLSISCCSAVITPSVLEELLTNCQHIKKMYLNREVTALLDTAVQSANAKNVVRNGTELTGEGVTVAVIDTGIYPHQDLSGRITGFVDFINQRTDPYDDNGHGTHCAGDALGDGSASSGVYQGPAPKANVIGVKVLDKMGSGSLETIMQGVEWCINYNQEHPNQPIHIISLSLGAPAQQYDNENDDPMVQIVEKAWEEGITVCVAAGNEGPEARTIASPGISDQVITVGALDDRDTAETRSDDDVASFSSRGPTIYGKEKPDILAPGVDIVSLRSPNSYLDKLQKANRVGSDYFVLSGTSMATPICAGVAALILQHNPNATPDEIKELLKSGTDLWRDRDPNIYGAGYLNAENSIPQ
ncbi:S8 family serine peptidase [Halalkalibacter urbisdiaboli]|uniref:S8 family serine peptidase n=1 Tax=Halalkalibacter urbisdiaboli TaxID=1960589 RepID=UPI000B441106|nr:S8 family serine peptidase [Halalkalibacter urbisdiaboli]